MRTLLGFVTVALTLLVATGDASAQDERWKPWLGCWDRAGQELLNTSPKGRSTSLPVDEDEAVRPRVCVTLTAPNEVTLTTTIPDEPVTQLIVRADGDKHAVDDGDCHGQQRTEWSQNGRRLFTNGEVTCRDGAPRFVSGLGLITDDGIWIDVRSFRIAERITTRVSRYERADGALSEPPLQGRATLSLAEIKEASKKVSEAVLEAAVAESGANVVVNKRSLVELAGAGVPPKVIDVLVALAYPERFRMERATDIDRENTVYSSSPISVPTNYYVPFYVPTAPINTSRGGGGDVFVGSGPGIYVPQLPPPNPGTASAINGQGYTRITPSDGPRPAIPRGGGDSGSVSSGNVSSSVSSSSGSSSSGSSSSGSSSSGSGSSGGGTGASPSGFSGGGGDTGRTAQPR